MKRIILSSLRRDQEDIFGMARIGWLPSKKGQTNIEVYVHTNDGGRIPHFHVRKYGKNNKFEWEVCVKYEQPEYFIHGIYRDVSSMRGLEYTLDRLLRINNPKDPGRTYWQSAIIAWNMNNSDSDLPYDLEQPDYTQL